MQIRRAGVHTVKKRLASGAIKEYRYAWRGGPRMKSEPDTREFALELMRLTRDRNTVKEKGYRNVRWLIAQYRQSPVFLKLKTVTREDYERHLLEIDADFHDLPLDAVSDTGMRAEFVAFRDRFAKTPRRADLILSVLRRLFTFALDKEWIKRNPLERVESLSSGTRRDEIWTDAEIGAFKAEAPEYMTRALLLALWTGQRQGDLLRLTWKAYDGTHISLVQSKTRRRVRVKVSSELRSALTAAKAINDAQKVPAATILTNGAGQPWKTGFKGMWRKTAGANGKTFHDLRGTFCTLAYRNGASFKEIAEASGHSEKEAERIIRTHYLAGDTVIEKLEARTKSVNQAEGV
jgi:integrase